MRGREEGSEAQDQCKGFVNGAELLSVKASSGPSQPLRVYNRGLLDEDPDLGSIE